MPRVILPDGRAVAVPDDATPEQLAAVRAKLRRDFKPEEFTFDDFKTLKARQAPKRKRPGVLESAGLIAERPGKAAATAGNLALRGVVGAGQAIGKGAASAARAASRPKEMLGKLGNFAEELITPEGATALAFGATRIGGAGQQLDKFAVRREARRRGIDLSDQDVEDMAEFAAFKIRSAAPGSALAGEVLSETALPAKAGLFKTTGRAATTGGALGAGRAASDDRDPAASAAFGAALPAAGPLIGTGAARLARPVTSRLPGATGVSARQQLGSIVEDSGGLGARQRQLSAASGEPVSVAETISTREAARLGERAALGAPEALDTLQGASRRVGAGRGGRMAQAAGGRAEAAQNVRSTANDRFTLVMQPQDDFGRKGLNLGAREVKISGDTAEFFTQPEFIRSLPASVREALQEATAENFAAATRAKQAGRAVPPKRPATITLSQLDETRRSLKATEGRSTEGSRAFLDARNRAEEIGTAQVPKYGQELRRLAREEERARQIEAGRAAFSKPTAETRAQAARLGERAEELTDVEKRGRAAAGERGFEQGQRSAVIEQATRGRSQSANAARRLIEDGTLRSQLALSFGGREAARLARSGRAEMQRAESLGTATVAAAQGSRAALRNANLVNNVIEGSIIAGGRASGGFQANFIQNVIATLGVPRRVAQRMAEDAVDPVRAPRLIAQLKRRQLNDDQIAQLYRASGIAAGVIEDEAQ